MSTNPFLDLIAPYLQLKPDELEVLRPYISKQNYKKNDFIFRAGEHCNELFFLTHGLIRCFYLYQEHEVNLRLLCEASAVLQLSSFISGEPSDEDIQAITESSGYRFRLRAFLDEVPGKTSEHIARVIAEQHYLAMERRLKTLQRKSAEQRYHYFCKHMEPRIVEDVPSYHIASYLGIAAESLSRLKKQS